MQDRPLGPGWPGQDTAGLWRCIPASPERGRNLHSPHRCGNSSPRVYLTNGSVALSVVTGRADVSRSVVIGITELVRTVFSGLSVLVIEDVEAAGGVVCVRARTRDGAVACPGCGAETGRPPGISRPAPSGTALPSGDHRGR